MSLSANPSRRRLSPCEGERGQSFQIGSKRKGDLGYTMGTQEKEGFAGQRQETAERYEPIDRCHRRAKRLAGDFRDFFRFSRPC